MSRYPHINFAFDPNKKHDDIELSTNYLSAFSSTNKWKTVFGNIQFKSGSHYWEVRLDNYDIANTYNVVIGVVPAEHKTWDQTYRIGLSKDYPGWAFITGKARISNNQKEQCPRYGRKCKQGDRIGVLVDCDNRTISFYINGESGGIAYRNVNVNVRPAVSLINEQKITLLFKDRHTGETSRRTSHRRRGERDRNNRDDYEYRGRRKRRRHHFSDKDDTFSDSADSFDDGSESSSVHSSDFEEYYNRKYGNVNSSESSVYYGDTSEESVSDDSAIRKRRRRKNKSKHGNTGSHRRRNKHGKRRRPKKYM